MAKHAEYSEPAVCRYYDTVKIAFEKEGLALLVTLTEFQVIEQKSTKMVFSCPTIAGVDGFLRGLMCERDRK